ncbi:MAG: DUF1905 domain-containing protein [Candidatus Dormibacteraceae bacterium]
MSSDTEKIPDYDLQDLRVVSSPGELRALADPLRLTILELALERAATVGELASAVERPRSTVAYHVGLLVDAGMLKVVRTRRVRAIDERFYGRTARIFYVGAVRQSGANRAPALVNDLSVAAAESAPAHQADDLRAIIRHARIPRERVVAFWGRVLELTHEFMQLPRSSETVYGFVAGLYPTEYPTLPAPVACAAMEFHATLERNGKSATGIEVPRSVLEELGGGNRPAVRATIKGYTWRTSVGSMGGRSLLPVSAEARQGAGVAAGDQLDVSLVLDTAAREVEIPEDLAAALATAATARAAFEALTYSGKRRLVLPIVGAKGADTRSRRIARAIEALNEGRA